MSKKLRYGIIGLGARGGQHVKLLLDNECPSAELTAVCDIDPAKVAWAKEKLPKEIKVFDNEKDFYESKAFDAVLVVVPHYDHPRLGMKAFDYGYHALVEKPAGVYTLQVKELIEASKKTDKLFGLMYNQRTNPVYKKVVELVQSPDFGEIKKVVWIVTDWYRSQSYYNSSNWRATWEGEGGGVLLNQSPHQLDLWQWICGMPTAIKADLAYGRNRDIEVENDATIFAKYANGATGLFVTSTHETPGTNRLEISGDSGKIVVEGTDEIMVYKNSVLEPEFNATMKDGFGKPEVEVIKIQPEGENPQHVGIMQNFAEAVLNGTPLIAKGEEGLKMVSIANAAHLSDWTGEWVDPQNIDEHLFKKLLDERIEKSTFVKETVEITMNSDKSY